AMTSHGCITGPPRRVITWLGLLPCALAITVLGCSYGISVRHSGGPDLFGAWRASAVESDEVSPRTQQTPRQCDLDQQFVHHPSDAYGQLQALAVVKPEPDLLFALAEISYLLGRRAEKTGATDTCCYYYLCAGYAYHFLFDPAGTRSDSARSARSDCQSD